MQGLQTSTEAEQGEEDLDQLYAEAQQLIVLIAPQPDPGSWEDLDEFWGPALSGFGEDWLDILEDVLDEAEEAEAQGHPYHHNGQMYWRVLERCYQLLKEEEEPLCRELFRECLSCLRATRTLHESEARQREEKHHTGSRL